jgi:RNA polymerase sigma-70 factor, ECF subfamily
MADTNPEWFDALVTPHLPLLYRVAWRLVRNSPDAHDLVQDTCIAACENLATLAAADHPERWLLRVLQNHFINVNKRRGRAPFVPIDEEAGAAQLASSEPGPEELQQQRDGERALERAFLQLEEAQRTLLALRAEGYDLTEIATITGVGKEVLRARLHRARSSLARHLEQPHEAPPRVASRPGSAS